MRHPTTVIRRWLLAQTLHNLMKQRGKDASELLRTHGIEILKTVDDGTAWRVEYRHNQRIATAVFPHAQLQADAKGRIERWSV